MFKINIKGVEHQMKSDANELTIKEYEKLSSILNDENTQNIEKYFKAFINLGMDEDVLDSLDGFSFLKIIKEFKEIMMPVGDIVKEITLNGRTYSCYNEEFFFSVKDMKMIEIAIKRNPTEYIGDLMSIIYKDNELTKVEHYDAAHLKYKAKMIREQVTYDVALPIITKFSKQLIESLESYKND